MSVSPRLRITAFILTAFGVAVATACGRPSQPPRAEALAPSPPLKSDAEIRDLDIAYFTARANADPTGALDLARLSALYLARGRVTGDPRDAILAEQVARRSMHNRKERNGAASQVLETALLAQHRFDEAMPIARRALDADPESATLNASLGDIQMELGQYDSARVSFSRVKASYDDPSTAPRLARWAEIEGHPEKARIMLRATLRRVLKTSNVPAEQVGWFWLRAGDLELRTGKFAEADSAYRSGLKAHPDDYRLLSALAHSALLQEKWQDAVAFGERAIGVTLDPATLGVLSDAYRALGDTAKSDEYAHVLDVAVLKQPGAYHRAWSLFLLDHDRHIATVSAKIREEMKTRKDVYAYDLLAWSLHKQGRDREAQVAMSQGLSQGTRDAQLYYHAGEIERALGMNEASRQHLALARAVNPLLYRVKS